jgi:hypothetical protein
MATQKNILLRQLPAKHRKLVQSIVERCDKQLSREEYFRLQEKQWKTELDKYSSQTLYEVLFENLKSPNSCTDEEAEALATARILSLDLLARGVARRIVNDDPAELECALRLGTRIEWVESCLPRLSSDQKYPNIWTVFHGLAASDIEVARAFFGASPGRLTGGHYPTVLVYNTIQAIVTENRAEQVELSSEIQFPTVPEYYRAVLRTLYGIITQDSALIATELEHVLSVFRRFDFIEHEKIVSIIAHGLAELAYWIAPPLLAKFDVERTFPWDSGYYNWLRRKNRSCEYLDVSKHSALLHRWLHDLHEPSWWHRRKV